MRKLLVIGACLVLVFAVYLSYSTVDEGAPTAIAGKTYKGTVYVAGHGGHFAEAHVLVDPSNNKEPIKVEKLEIVRIGTGASHKTHDARIDSNDRTKMYWSTYKFDKSDAGKKIGPKTLHVGLSDLKTREVIKDVALQTDKRAKWTSPIYCASGQTDKTFMPVTMTHEAYIDVFEKGSLKLLHRVFLDKLGYKNNYFFMHGVNSHDMKTFAVAMNMTSKWSKPSKPGKMKGKIDMVLLDLKALEKGKAKELARNTLSGKAGKTITFRETFTYDNKLLLQSGGDRMFVLDAKTLKVKGKAMPLAGENHDAVPTPDNKFALLTVRTSKGEGKAKKVDGALQLYDIKKNKVYKNTASVCVACHAKMGLDVSIPKAILCGADVNWD
jgi:hypothetical protein